MFMLVLANPCPSSACSKSNLLLSEWLIPAETSYVSSWREENTSFHLEFPSKKLHHTSSLQTWVLPRTQHLTQICQLWKITQALNTFICIQFVIIHWFLYSDTDNSKTEEENSVIKNDIVNETKTEGDSSPDDEHSENAESEMNEEITESPEETSKTVSYLATPNTKFLTFIHSNTVTFVSVVTICTKLCIN